MIGRRGRARAGRRTPRAAGAPLLCLALSHVLLAVEAPAVQRVRPTPAADRDPAVAHIVPRPRHLRALDGSFQLSDPVRIDVASPDARTGEIASLLAGVLRARTGFEVRVARDEAGPREAAIRLVLVERPLVEPGAREEAGPEAYALRVTSAGVEITARDSRGLLWGVQTLRQLLPPEFERSDGERRRSWTIPSVEIEDAPRFGWRGSLMDVSRHFVPVEFVKRYVDLLSRYKMNVLHWHLTDDQGWRLEIERYPRLTEVAAWRTEPDGSRHGGFYTREDVREVVEHARLRGVRVVPEIEMPGHASAALVAYPELACADPPREVPSSWGVFPDIFCVGEPATFTFLENVLSEVAELFPSPYVHIGGDEVPKRRWEECAPCLEVMQREGITDQAALQAWFLGRIAAHLRSLGKTMVGWDEILEGGGVPGSVVQVWRDPATVREAIRRGHDVVASPTSHAYFDYSPAALPLEQVYSFDPAAGLAGEERDHLLGGEGNLWSEYITTANFDFQAFPRILALAEALWSSGERSYADFRDRLEADQYARLRASGVRPGPEDADVIRITVHSDSSTGEPRVTVRASVEGLRVRYTTDGSTPTASSPELTDTTSFADGDDVTLGVFAGGAALPLRRGFEVVDHLARGRPVRLADPPDGRYPGPGEGALTDGLRGSDNHRDGVWQGWWDDDLDATVDLGVPRPIAAVSVSFLENEGAWILPPESVAIFVSRDGETWREAGTDRATELAEGVGGDRATLTLSIREEAAARGARYVRVAAVRGVLPEGHPGAGEPGWLFVDEIVVR